MDLKLKNKTALVTGSTAGIGFAIAALLAEEGATVVINGRTEARVNAAIDKIKATNPDAKLIPVAADLSTTEGIASVTSQIKSVDILINNFGLYEMKAFNDITDQDWFDIFNTNVMSGVRLSRHYLPPMLKNNWGRIVFISSESALQIPTEMIHYGMSKTAQLAVSRGLAEMTAGTNVTVNAILPGPTDSEGVKTFVEQMAANKKVSSAEIEKEFFATARPSSIIKRFETPEEIANMVAFICSPLASGTNGAALRVEGGIVRSIV
ncbi:MAG: SDR family NAD(P)-dependent oxidoreductase [Gammaproteobacteria bacterium]|nr:SDR family NAD(P)-dependent oxidoreductase [Gammaproteobacteria bacterium]